jgi:acetyltransferase-like isoleucine patch superfamily enzyme
MGFKIGKNSYIFMGCTFDSSGGLEVGENSVINPNCRLDTRGGLTIGDSVSISSDTIILTADHDMSNNMEGRVLPIKIEDYVWVGTRSMILPGVEVKKGSVIAAGALVTRSVQENAVVGGVPARVLRIRENPRFDYNASYKRLFQ